MGVRTRVLVGAGMLGLALLVPHTLAADAVLRPVTDVQELAEMGMAPESENVWVQEVDEFELAQRLAERDPALEDAELGFGPHSQFTT